jgi:hypothetical protein
VPSGAVCASAIFWRFAAGAQKYASADALIDVHKASDQGGRKPGRRVPPRGALQGSLAFRPRSSPECFDPADRPVGRARTPFDGRQDVGSQYAGDAGLCCTGPREVAYAPAADIKLIGCAVGLIEKANALSAEQNQGNAILN